MTKRSMARHLRDRGLSKHKPKPVVLGYKEMTHKEKMTAKKQARIAAP